MKFTYSWLTEHLETTKTPQEIAEKLTSIGLEVDEFTNLGAQYAPFLVAEIVEATQHPNADRLRVCKVNDGTTVHQIVCGAPNARAGIKVIMAPIGALIPNGNFEIKKSKIRDVESCGMLCSADELELGGDSTGIIELPADAPVGTKYAEYAGLNDSFYEIAITPNRQDCLGVRGVARDLAAAGFGTLKALDLPNENQPSANFILRSLKNVKNGASPSWLQARLKSIGLNPISALVDITNYITFDLGRPSHVYDADKISGELRVTSDGKGSFKALNDKTFELENDFIIADDRGAVALAGVIGGVETSVDENTKNITLEVSYFDPETVAKSGRKYQIDSDARYRFERGVDPEGLQQGLEQLTKLILEVCGGEVGETKFAGETVKWQRDFTFNFDLIKDLGGVEISQAQAEQILKNLGFTVAGSKVTPPSWRRDIEGAPDLVEEIIRIIGLDKITPQPLPFAVPSKLPADRLRKNAALDVLSNRGMKEVVTYSFTSAQNAKTFGGGAAELRLQYPISEDLSEMRPSILPNLLEAAVRNANRGMKNLGLFEVGPVFAEIEQTVIAGLRVGKTADKNIYTESRNVDAFDAKADILAVLAALGAPENLQLREDAPAYFHPGRSAGLYLGKNCLGYFGEIHPQILKQFDCNLPSVGFEIFIKNTPASNRKFKALEVSDLQAVGRDFAFTLARDVKVGEIIRRIEKLDDLIVGAEVFDVYEGDKIDADKKSVAFSITLQPKAVTLQDRDIEAISVKVIAFVENEYAGKLRA